MISLSIPQRHPYAGRMPDSTQRFIETAVRSMSGDAEMKLAADRLLREIAAEDAPAMETAVAGWEEADSNKRRFKWRFLLLALLVMSAVIVPILATPGASRFRKQFTIGQSMYAPGVTPPSILPTGRGDLTEEEQLILYGDVTRSSETEKAKGRWERHPENPAYFSSYVSAHLSEHTRLPDEFLSIARQIAPGNSWFTYLAAAEEAKAGVRRKHRPRTSDPHEWEILSEKNYQRALQLLREAGAQPDFDDYKTELVRQKIPLLNQDGKLAQVHSIFHLMTIPSSDIISFLNLGSIISAEAFSLAEERDITGFRELMKDAEALVQHQFSAEPGNQTTGLVYYTNISIAYEGLASGARTLGLPEAEKYQLLYDRMKERYHLLSQRDTRVDGVDLLEKADFLMIFAFSMTTHLVENPPKITDEVLKPGRLAEHEIMSAGGALSAFLLLGFSALVCWAFRFRQPRMIRGVTPRVESLLRPADWAGILGFGVILPFATVLLLNRHTPLGARDFGVSGMESIMPAAQYLGLVLLLLLLPVLIIRQRLAKRAGAFGFRQKSSIPGWIAVACTAAFTLLIGFAAKDGSNKVLLAASLLLLPQALWLAAALLLAVYTSPARLLRSGTTAKILIPAYGFAILLFIWLIPPFVASAGKWSERDESLKLDPAFPGITPYEYKVAVQLQKETRELLRLRDTGDR